jgi:hypothetical protein
MVVSIRVKKLTDLNISYRILKMFSYLMTVCYTFQIILCIDLWTRVATDNDLFFTKVDYSYLDKFQ